MRHNEFDVRIAVRDLLGDHMQYKGRVLERGADGPPVVVVNDKRRADSRSCRVHEQHGTAPVHLGVDRLELGFGDRATETDDVHVDADAAQLIEAALHLLQCGVDMGQWQHHIGGDALRVAVRQVSIAVVEHLHRFNALPLVGEVRRMVRRQDLLLDPRLIHQPESALDVLRRIREGMARHSALDRQMDRRGKPVAHELTEISRRIVRMDVADHRAAPLCSRPVRVGGALACWQVARTRRARRGLPPSAKRRILWSFE